MNNLLGSLGLDAVSADVNSMPDNKYEGVITRSELVVNKDKATISHVITYQVESGDYKGREKAEWFKLGKDPVDANGNPAERGDAAVGYTPDMSEAAKPWYKKRWVDLGVPEEQVGQVGFDTLVGIHVVFGVKTNGSYQNINFVERRANQNSPTAAAAQSLGTNEQTQSPAPTTPGGILSSL